MDQYQVRISPKSISSFTTRRQVLPYPEWDASVPLPKRCWFEKVQWEAGNGLQNGTIVGMCYVSNKLSLLTGMPTGWKVYVQREYRPTEAQISQCVGEIAVMPENWARPVGF